MEAVFLGFLNRPQFHQSMGCGLFEFDAGQDLLVAAGQSDPGLYTRAHELLGSYRQTHRYAVVVLDEAWNGSPGADKIRSKIGEALEQSGWNAGTIAVIVICPELEAWICHDSPNVEAVLGCQKLGIGLKDYLVQEKLWEAQQPKPIDPKSGIEQVLRLARIPRSSAVYRQITEKISVKRCIDPAFQQLRDTLQQWFPMDNH